MKLTTKELLRVKLRKKLQQNKLTLKMRKKNPQIEYKT